MTGGPSVCVVIPMHNEEAGGERCIRAVCRSLEAMAVRSALLVVDDGSRDRTAAIVAELAQQEPRLLVTTHPQNLGYGAALKTGGRRAAELGYDYVLFMDSDLTNDPQYLPSFMARMREGYDVIKASRYIPRGGVRGVPPHRMVISAIGNRVASLLYGVGVRDCTNGFRAIKTSVLRRMQLTENGFAVIMEELYQAKFLGCTFCEIPYVLTARSAVDKPSSFTYAPRVFRTYLRYPLKSFLNRVPRHLAGEAFGASHGTHGLPGL